MTNIEKAKAISKIVNDWSFNPMTVAAWWGYKEHRTLQNEMFKFCFHFIEHLARAHRECFYDGRNEWACKMASHMLDGLKQHDDWVDSDERLDEMYDEIKYER